MDEKKFMDFVQRGQVAQQSVDKILELGHAKVELSESETKMIKVICNAATMALADIVHRHQLAEQVDSEKLVAALRMEIRADYNETIRDAREAMVLGVPLAKASLSASCRLMALHALQNCGYLPKGGASNAPTT